MKWVIKYSIVTQAEKSKEKGSTGQAIQNDKTTVNKQMVDVIETYWYLVYM